MVTSNYAKIRLPLLVFVLFTVFEVVLGRVLNTTWEWDSAIRSMQGYEVATKGLGWYFSEGSGHYVWLPFWQLLIGSEYSLLRIDAILLGEVTSALCAGGVAVYVSAFLRKYGLSESRSVLGSLMLLSFGNYVSYSSQAMTESLSILLFLACLYHLYRYYETGSLRSLGIASMASLLHVTTRYEAWFFLVTIAGSMFLKWALSENSRFKFVGLIHIILFCLPSIVFIGLWLEYNLAMTKSIFGFRDWILANNGHEDQIFYRNVGFTLIMVLGDLFLSLGAFWMSMAEQLRRLAGRSQRIQDDMRILFGLLFLGYVFYFAYSMFTGFNNGWPRHLLYFVPISIITFMSDRFERKPTSYIMLAFNIVLGLVAFASNLQAHNLFVQSGP